MPGLPVPFLRAHSRFVGLCLWFLAAGFHVVTAAEASVNAAEAAVNAAEAAVNVAEDALKVADASAAAAKSPSSAAAKSAPADSKASRAESDPRAREALGKAVRFHREAKDLSLAFKASVYNAALDKQDRYEGKLLLKGASRFRLEIPGGTYVSDGETYWEYHPGTGQAIMRRARDMEDKPLPGDILLRFLDSEPLSLAETQEDGRRYLEMRLDPSRAMKNLDSLAVLLDEKDFSLHRISSRDVSGNEAEYTVVKVRRNGGIKDKAFAFVPPKGAEVVDMRDE